MNAVEGAYENGNAPGPRVFHPTPENDKWRVIRMLAKIDNFFISFKC